MDKELKRSRALFLLVGASSLGFIVYAAAYDDLSWSTVVNGFLLGGAIFAYSSASLMMHQSRMIDTLLRDKHGLEAELRHLRAEC